MENKFNDTREVISNTLGLPRDIMLNLPKITITGDNEIIIENHKGIVLFEKEFIKINSSIGLICIYGNSLEVLFMGGNTIILSGKFKSVVYEGNE